MAVLIFIFILGILVFVHEFGHFMVARWSGVAVEEFGFGFPPRMIGIQRGPTTYSINWIPFGGFVRLQGEQSDKEKRADSFVQARFSRQLAIMVAGVFMNALLAWVLLTATLLVGVKIDASNIPTNKYVQDGLPRIEAIVNESTAAAAAGLHNGDVVFSINGQALTTTDQVIAFTKDNNYPPITIEVQRRTEKKTITITPQTEDNKTRYGFGLQKLAIIRYPWYIAPWFGLTTTVDMIGQTFAGFGKLFHDLATTAKVSSDVTGPVGIAVLTGQVVQYGFIATLQFMAILSISLAVVNILPLPALDGGRAFFVIVGRLRGRAVDTRIEGTIHTIGFYLLLLIILLISIRDITKFKLLEQFQSLF